MSRPTSLIQRARMLTPPMPWHRPQLSGNPNHPPVILLHGLWRSKFAMQPMAHALQHAGFSTLNIPYPSARMTVPELVDRITRTIDATMGDRPIHVLTHSLGGILARYAVSQGKWNVRRMVMTAPPSAGSEIVDKFHTLPLLHHLLGPAGQSLGTSGLPPTLPELPASIEAAAIMGRRDAIKCFKGLIPGEHDGIVSVKGGKTPDLKQFAVVEADHTFITAHPETQRLAIEFFQTGNWND